MDLQNLKEYGCCSYDLKVWNMEYSDLVDLDATVQRWINFWNEDLTVPKMKGIPAPKEIKEIFFVVADTYRGFELSIWTWDGTMFKNLDEHDFLVKTKKDIFFAVGQYLEFKEEMDI